MDICCCYWALGFAKSWTAQPLCTWYAYRKLDGLFLLLIVVLFFSVLLRFFNAIDVKKTRFDIFRHRQEQEICQWIFAKARKRKIDFNFDRNMLRNLVIGIINYFPETLQWRTIIFHLNITHSFVCNHNLNWNFLVKKLRATRNIKQQQQD